MKKLSNDPLLATNYFIVILLFIAINTSCKKYDAVPVNAAASQSNDNISLDGFSQVNLVADKAVFGAPRLDHKLQNAWGMSADDEGEIWVSANETGLSFVYGPAGQHLLPAVSIPSHDANVPGNPTGNIYNSTSDFIIPGTNMRFGVDGLVGLIPGIGDALTTVISLWLVKEAHALGAPGHLVARMLGNIAIDGVVGAVPILGDAFDLVWKSNRRNMHLLRRHLDRERSR